MRLMILILIILPMTAFVQGQNAPVTTAAEMNSPIPGSNIIVPITVTNFQYIGAITLTLDYDHSVLNFVQGTKNAAIPGMFIITDNDLGNGFHRLLMGWYGFGLSLPDNSSIMDIEFNYISGSTELAWMENGPSCEYADGNYVVMDDLPTEDFYINGNICGLLGIPGPISGDDQVCQLSSSVSYSIDTVSNASSYIWSVPVGASIVFGQNTNSILVDYSDTAQSENIAVFASNPCAASATAQLPISVYELPFANAGNDTLIPYGTSTTLHAATGGSGNFIYAWTPADLLVDPEVQHPQTVIMTASSLFTVTIINESTLCQQSDNVLLSISGGPLSVNPVAYPDEICNGESAQLFANSGGGSGAYTYSWTSVPAGSPPWYSDLENPVVTPDSNKTFFVEVNDGFSTTSGEIQLLVYDLPTAYISGGGSLCGDSSSILLPVDLTGIPPWSFTYSFRNSTVHISDVTESPYFINASDSGTYIVFEVEDVNCSGLTSGSATVVKYPIPSTPEIEFADNELISNATNGNQWYRDGIAIEGAIGTVYSPLFDGTYFDIVTLNSCPSDTSNSIDVLVTNMDELQAGFFQTYPNPAGDQIRLKTNSKVSGNLSMKLYTISKQFVFAIEMNLNETSPNKTIDISNLCPGVYILSVSTDTFLGTQKIIVH